MKLILERNRIDKNGAFGLLLDQTRDPIAYTLEHTYAFGSDGNDKTLLYLPKIPDGTYECFRGIHRLEHGGVFTTFEVINVPNHDGILFHTGNTEQDSHGCILLGTQIVNDQLIHSRTAFYTLMRILHDQATFTLEVKS